MNTVTVKTQVIGVLQSLNANPTQTIEMLDRLWRFTKIYEKVPTFYLFTIGDKLDFCWGWGNDNPNDVKKLDVTPYQMLHRVRCQDV
jgi:hypothetical protein